MLPDSTRLSKTLALVDKLLHEGHYSELERLSGGKRLTANEIKQGLDDYPEPLTTRPAYELEDDDVVYVTGSAPAQWSVYLHLWRRDGGRSDLTAELTVVDTDSGLYGVEIEGIHVL
jgi:hypothetical protein